MNFMTLVTLSIVRVTSFVHRFRVIFPESHWLDSDLIPRLLENFENWENVTVSLLNIKNEAYRLKFECVGVF